MTSVTAPPPPPVGQPPAGHAVLRFTASLSGALDRLAQTPTWSMTRAEQREALVELRRQRNRLQELELRVLVQADRDDVGADSGAVSTPAWLAHATRTSTASCSPRPAPRRQARRAGSTPPGPRSGGRGDRRGEGEHRHRRRRAADRGVRRPAGRHRGAGRGAPARAGPGVRRPHAAAAGQAAVRGGLPRGRRRGRGREAGEGRGPGPGARFTDGPRPRRRHQRGTVPAAHPARAPAEEGARGAHQPTTDRRGPAGPRDRDEAARTPPCSGTG